MIFTSLLGNGEVDLGAETIDRRRTTWADGGVRCDQRVLHEHRDLDRSSLRDGGVLKRTRGTPLPAWSYLGARVIARGAHRLPARRDHGGVRRRRLRRELPDRRGPVPIRRDAPGGCGVLRGARPRGHRLGPERRRGTADHQRDRSCRSCSSRACSSRPATTLPRGSPGSVASSRSDTSRTPSGTRSWVSRRSAGPTSGCSRSGWSSASSSRAAHVLPVGTPSVKRLC